jgi:hypothetical protein
LLIFLTNHCRFFQTKPPNHLSRCSKHIIHTPFNNLLPGLFNSSHNRFDNSLKMTFCLSSTHSFSWNDLDGLLLICVNGFECGIKFTWSQLVWYLDWCRVYTQVGRNFVKIAKWELLGRRLSFSK